MTTSLPPPTFSRSVFSEDLKAYPEPSEDCLEDKTKLFAKQYFGTMFAFLSTVYDLRNESLINKVIDGVCTTANTASCLTSNLTAAKEFLKTFGFLETTPDFEAFATFLVGKVFRIQNAQKQKELMVKLMVKLMNDYFVQKYNSHRLSPSDFNAEAFTSLQERYEQKAAERATLEAENAYPAMALLNQGYPSCTSQEFTNLKTDFHKFIQKNSPKYPITLENGRYTITPSLTHVLGEFLLDKFGKAKLDLLNIPKNPSISQCLAAITALNEIITPTPEAIKKLLNDNLYFSDDPDFDKLVSALMGKVLVFQTKNNLEILVKEWIQSHFVDENGKPLKLSTVPKKREDNWSIEPEIRLLEFLKAYNINNFGDLAPEGFEQSLHTYLKQHCFLPTDMRRSFFNSTILLFITQKYPLATRLLNATSLQHVRDRCLTKEEIGELAKNCELETSDNAPLHNPLISKASSQPKKSSFFSCHCAPATGKTKRATGFPE